jgi:hypothetical protein
MELDLDELKRDVEINRKERIDFVRRWADYVKRNPNDVWSSQQADLINSVFKNANVDPKTYMKTKLLMSELKRR